MTTNVAFFGERWDVPAEHGAAWVDIPVGEPCAYVCGQVIADGDDGMLIWHFDPDQDPGAVQRPWHRRCFLHHCGISSYTPV